MIVASAGCDNVEWGGAEIRLQPPSPATATVADDTLSTEPGAPPPPPLPEGAVLFMGTRDGARVTLRPVAELRGDTVAALLDDDVAPGFAEHFRARRLQPGTELVLFAGGSRVGTVMADTSAVVTGACGVHPTVSGLAELLLPASQATRFLALARDRVPDATHGAYTTGPPTADHQGISLNLASRVILREEAYWPDDLGDARADLQVIPLPETGDPAIAATFMFRDRLAEEPAENALAYSLFVMGSGGPEGHDMAFDWYHEASDGGKRAPRYFEQADWDGDGESEVLLEVMGADRTWVVALDRRDGRWERVFEHPCASGPASEGD